MYLVITRMKTFLTGLSFNDFSVLKVKLFRFPVNLIIYRIASIRKTFPGSQFYQHLSSHLWPWHCLV